MSTFGRHLAGLVRIVMRVPPPLPQQLLPSRLDSNGGDIHQGTRAAWPTFHGAVAVGLLAMAGASLPADGAGAAIQGSVQKTVAAVVEAVVVVVVAESAGYPMEHYCY